MQKKQTHKKTRRIPSTIAIIIGGMINANNIPTTKPIIQYTPSFFTKPLKNTGIPPINLLYIYVINANFVTRIVD